MNRSQGPRSRFRTEITRRAAEPCRGFNWVSAELAPHPYLYSYIWRGGGPFFVWPSTELLSDKLWEKSANYAKLCNLRWKNALTPKLNKVQKSCSCSTRNVGEVRGRGSCTRRPVSCSVFSQQHFLWQVFAVCFPRVQASPPRELASQPKVMTRPDVLLPLPLPLPVQQLLLLPPSA